jgi:hypothetical protein
MATNIDKFLEPSEVAAATAVPVGGIIMWMNPSAASMNPTPPAGFEYCDGTAVSTIGSPMLGITKPSLMITSAGGAKGIARGANVNAAPYGVGTALVQGGADTHNHTTNAAGAHTHGMKNHTHLMQSHTHPVASSGAHDHSLTDTANTAGVPATGTAFQGGLFYHNHSVTSTNSAHTHVTDGPSSNVTAAPNDNTTDASLDHSHSVNNNSVFPAFHTELAFIVRVL